MDLNYSRPVSGLALLVATTRFTGTLVLFKVAELQQLSAVSRGALACMDTVYADSTVLDVFVLR